MADHKVDCSEDKKQNVTESDLIFCFVYQKTFTFYEEDEWAENNVRNITKQLFGFQRI